MEERNHAEDSLNDLKDIRRIMDRSTRFISLSGLSGIAAGICALIGLWFASRILNDLTISESFSYNFKKNTTESLAITNLLIIAIVTFIAAFLSAFYLTYLKSKKSNLPIWDRSSRRLLVNMFVPLITGGLFIIGLISYNELQFIAPSCLIFYGLALVNASHYTLSEVRYLGYCEILLGLLNFLFLQNGLYFLVLGFGMLHIFYGAYMWWKYEKAKI